MDDSNRSYSPATGLDSISAGGSTSSPPESTIYPDFNLTERGAQAPSMKQQGEIAGVGSTSGAVPFSQLFDGPTTPPGDVNDPMVGGLGNPPRP